MNLSTQAVYYLRMCVKEDFPGVK